jgi:hypothetical protein
MVIFRNRISFQPKAEVRYPVLAPEAYLHAKQLHRAMTCISWSRSRAIGWVESGMPELGFPDKAFVGFCKQRYQRKPNP